jgi:hypothetical protein
MHWHAAVESQFAIDLVGFGFPETMSLEDHQVIPKRRD